MTYEDKSILLILFEDLRARILDQVSDITEVVIWTNQYTDELVQRPFAYPYVGIEMVIEWDRPEAKGSVYPNVGHIGYPKKGIVTITVHTMFLNREDDTQTFIQNEPIRHKVHRAIDLLCHADGFYTQLLKRRDNVPVDIDMVQDYITIYEAGVKEGAIIIGEEGEINEIEVNSGRPTPLIIS